MTDPSGPALHIRILVPPLNQPRVKERTKEIAFRGLARRFRRAIFQNFKIKINDLFLLEPTWGLKVWNLAVKPREAVEGVEVIVRQLDVKKGSNSLRRSLFKRRANGGLVDGDVNEPLKE